VKNTEHIAEEGVRMYEAASQLGFEGAVGKRAHSTYEPGVRSQSWLKFKNTNEQEFVVGGYTEGEGSRSKTFGGLLVGYYDGDDLRFAASVGSGLTERMLDDITAKLRELGTDESPFVNPPTVIGGRWAGDKSSRCFWVRSELVARVRFASWTREGNLRAPVFLGLRNDIDPRSIRREQAAPAAIDVIEPDVTPERHGSMDETIASILD